MRTVNVQLSVPDDETDDAVVLRLARAGFGTPAGGVNLSRDSSTPIGRLRLAAERERDKVRGEDGKRAAADYQRKLLVLRDNNNV